MADEIEKSIDLSIPEEIRYSCVQCGESCSLFYEITLDETSRKRLEEVDYRDLLPSDVKNLKPYHESPVDDRRLTMRKRNGTCVFQREEDGLCGVHKQYGYQQKPQNCMDFPYRFVQTPEKAYVGLSFACTAVLGNEGKPLTEQRADLEQHIQVTNAKRESHKIVRLTRRHEISWEAYRQLEESLLAIMEAKNFSVAEKLSAQSVFLDLLVPLLRQVRGDWPDRRYPLTPKDLGGEERFPANCGKETDLTIMEAGHKKFIEQDSMERLFRMARTAKGNKTFHRAFIGLMIGFRQNIYLRERNPSRFLTALSIVKYYLKAMFRLGRIELEALPARFDYKAFNRYGSDWLQDVEIAHLLYRFFHHTIERKDLLLSESVWLGQRMMLMHYALLQWHVVGNAALEEKDRIDLHLVKIAIRDLERFYVMHADFGALFEKFPTLGSILDGAARRPTYAASLTLPPV